MNFIVSRGGFKGPLVVWLIVAVWLLAVVFSLVFPHSVQAAQVLFSDGFETGNFSAWDTAGNKWTVTNNAKLTGNKGAEVEGNTQGANSLLKTVSAAGYHDLTLKYWYRVRDGLEAGDHFQTEWSADGQNWNLLSDVSGVPDTTTWLEVSQPLPPAAADQPALRIRFSASFNAGNDRIFIDDVILVGQPIIPPPPLTGFIFGLKYHDYNGNGFRDVGEPGLPNWPVELYAGESLATTTATNAGGFFYFPDLLPGAYRVCEDGSLNGWRQTDPHQDGGSSWLAALSRILCGAGTWGYQIDLAGGAEVYGVDFGNLQLAAVRITKVAVPAEGLFTFRLTGPGGYEETMAVVGSTAEPLEFLNLWPGTYALSEGLPEDWSGERSVVCTDGETTLDPENLELVSGRQVHCIFNNSAYGVITGRKFNDTNINGTSDNGEEGLPGWTIRLYKLIAGENQTEGESENRFWQELATTVTGAGGAYVFSDLPADTYYLCEELVGGWNQSYPAAGPVCPIGGYGHEVIVTAGSLIEQRDFGNWSVLPPASDTEPPVTAITSPAPGTEWLDEILIAGTTTDNLAVASVALAYAGYTAGEGELAGSCGDFSLITDLAHLTQTAVFSWIYQWMPLAEGDYCLRAAGIDVAGNEEQTAIVFPIKFRKSPPPPPADAGPVAFSSGGSGFISFGTTTPPGLGGSETGFPPPPVSPLLSIQLSPVTSSGSAGGLTGAIATGSATASDLLGGTTSPVTGTTLLAALGNFNFSWWWLLLVILVIVIAWIGYRYWQQREDRQ